MRAFARTLVLVLALLPATPWADMTIPALCDGGYGGTAALAPERFETTPRPVDGSAFCCLVASSTLPSLATPILPGAETGMIVALMPPDAPTPTGGYCIPAMATDGLLLGDTVGATPGAYGCVHTPRRDIACIGLRTFHPLSCLLLHRLINA